MPPDVDRASTAQRRRPACGLRLPLAGVALALAIALVLPAAALPSGKAEAERLHAALTRMVKLANGMRPQAQQLGQDLSGGAGHLDRLREPAALAQEQLTTALAEMRQMATSAIDPHYTPALIAVGRAFMAVSGKDPLTKLTVNPEYQGLETELVAEAGRLHHSTEGATTLLREIKQLSGQLALARRHSHQLETALRRLRATDAAGSTGPR